jgi:transposase InsO family protein
MSDTSILMRRDICASRKVTQIVLPEGRRRQVLKMAHESGGHVGQKRTIQRIREAFWWTTVNQDAIEYVKTCEGCQIRSYPNRSDKIPIEPLARTEYPFQVVNMDCIAVPQGYTQKFKYLLVVVDYFSRYVEAEPLKTLSSRETVMSLIKIFANHGIPEIICSDNATNFSSRYTAAFYEIMGVAPRFSTPEHPASNGLVERANRTLKNLIYFLTEKFGKRWAEALPMALMAMRHCINESTRVAPITLATGQPPRGPLYILKKQILNGNGLSMILGKTDTEAIKEIQTYIQEAAKMAEGNFKAKSEAYAANYNKGTKDKSFQVGSEVILKREGMIKKKHSKVGWPLENSRANKAKHV